jgi:hypothetical protein
MYLGLGAHHVVQGLFCLRSQPLRIQLFISLYFITCCFVVLHRSICCSSDDEDAVRTCTSMMGFLPLLV